MRRTADPVVALLARHRDLCAQAVDPLEIAAGLEARGVTDRVAARFRHRDVFSLAEELYARAPDDDAWAPAVAAGAGRDTPAAPDGRTGAGPGGAAPPGTAPPPAARAVRDRPPGRDPGPPEDADGPDGAVPGGRVEPGRDGKRAPGPARPPAGHPGGRPLADAARHGARARSRPPRGRRPAAAPPGARARRTLRLRAQGRAVALHLAPGACAAGTVVAVPALPTGVPGAAWGVVAAGSLLTAAALLLCLRRGPLRAASTTGGVRPPRVPAAALLGIGWLLGYLLVGDRLLTRLLHGGPGPAWPPAVPAVTPDSWAATALVALALAVAPAAYCARWFARRARHRLRSSRALAEFSAGVRPLLPVALLLFLGALTWLVLAARLLLGAPGGHPDGGLLPPGPGTAPGLGATRAAAAVALGGLLFLARLLAVHGRTRAALAGVATACALEAAVLGLAAASRLPGGAGPARPVARVVTEQGAAAVPAVACALAALALLGYALDSLARASAHGVRAGTGPGAPV
ncbi:hypothetical protein [Streptomyces sp. NPDC018031]|uniref:hypothetical protein n=1 Tax=Streptomyces sp. NPDC018031 TaxID=3365033 RepID=UPI00379A05D1